MVSGMPVNHVPRVPLSVSHPTLAAQADGWDPSTVSAGSHKILPWVCDVGHRWEKRVDGRALVGAGCPKCREVRIANGEPNPATGTPSISDAYPKLAAEADGWDPSRVRAAAVTPRLRGWKCSDCGTQWQATPFSRVNGRTPCPTCFPTPGRKVQKTTFAGGKRTYVIVAGQRVIKPARGASLADLYPPVASALANPTDGYLLLPSSNAHMPFVCSGCGELFTARVNSRTHLGHGLCKTCASTLEVPAWVYWISGSPNGTPAKQIGVTRNLHTRLNNHRLNGFDIPTDATLLWCPTVSIAYEVEAAIKMALLVRDVPTLRDAGHTFNGASESWAIEHLPATATTLRSVTYGLRIPLPNTTEWRRAPRVRVGRAEPTRNVTMLATRRRHQIPVSTHAQLTHAA